MKRGRRLPVLLLGLVLMSQAFPLASPVRDAATGFWAGGYSLHLPPLYLIFAPFCGIAVRLSLLSYHQAVVFLAYLFVGLAAGLGVRRGLRAIFFALLFLAWTILVPHPMARLVAQNPDTLLIDFHSHSEVSHDGRPGFSSEANMRWHRAQGYDAAFITDHNRIESAQKAKAISRADWRQTGYRSLEGEEISLFRTHLVTLGVRERIDNRPYDSDAKKIPLFISDMHKRRIPVIASIPEYWWYHWDGSALGTIDEFVRWGVGGFEIINSAPKALDFPLAYRRRIIELCRTHNLPMTGISDNHGWGYATAAWNAMRIPGWQGMDPDQLETAVIRQLNTQGFSAVQVLERARYNPETVPELLITPFADTFLYWRSLQLLEVVSWIVWIWVFTFFYEKNR